MRTMNYRRTYCVDRSKRNIRKLGQLQVGEKLRLYAKDRSGRARPRFRFGSTKGGRYLAGETLTVLRHRGDAVIVSAGGVEVPLWSGLRVMG